MAVPWGLLTFLVGIAYGWFAPGKQDKIALAKMALLWGALAAIVVTLLGAVFGVNALGLADNGLVSNLIAVVVLTIAFVVGVWIGDMLPNGRSAGPRSGVRRV